MGAMREHEQRGAGRGLDFEIAAKVMGYDPVLIHDETGGKVVDYGSFKQIRVAPTPQFSTDIAAADQVEAEIARHMLGEQYARALSRVLTLEGVPQPSPNRLWAAAFRLLRASPRQRCLAALAALSSSSPRVVPEVSHD